jgi:AGCS family alanine or glycine:cation symporter
LEEFLVSAANFIWGTPLLILLLGGGIYFTVYSRLLPFKYFIHAINILRGKYDESEGAGEISHFAALSSHLAATVGMGNISGVAVAIATGGPGAIFWMWVSAIFGITTKFFTCTLALMYRGKDSEGNIQGGPMYFITEGMGKKWKPLAVFFCAAGFFAATPVFQTNQLVQITQDILLTPNNWGFSEGTKIVLANGDIWDHVFLTKISIGLVIAVFTGLVIFGGIKRIGSVAGKLVSAMVLIYIGSIFIILLLNSTQIIPSFLLIIEDAFTANSVLGGAVGAIIITGARRAAFSNEAGIGTAPMMHGAAKTTEPVREGLVAMLGPFIDTIIVCTMTGLAILITGVWQSNELSGISMTVQAFEQSIPIFGPYILALCVLIFAFTTILGSSYYGKKCLSFLIGAKYGAYFNYWYVAIILVGSVASLNAVVSLIDFTYALMAFPTMIAAVYLSPKVLKEAKRYFDSLNQH